MPDEQAVIHLWSSWNLRGNVCQGACFSVVLFWHKWMYQCPFFTKKPKVVILPIQTLKICNISMVFSFFYSCEFVVLLFRFRVLIIIAVRCNIWSYLLCLLHVTLCTLFSLQMAVLFALTLWNQCQASWWGVACCSVQVNCHVFEWQLRW
jgi:hypothetical protein